MAQAPHALDLTGDGGSSDWGGGQATGRTPRHNRAQSLTETHNHNHNSNNNSQGLSPISAGGTEASQSPVTPGGASLGGVVGASDLVRRHHTLGTSSSRLLRQERSRARLALQATGMPEADQHFYLPPSPVDSANQHHVWSDLGHGSSPYNHNFDYAPHSPSPPPEDTPSGSVPFPQPVQAQPKPSSSFVVVRGGRGDAALTDRASKLPPVSSSAAATQGASGLQHRNSLKPFLEAEAEAEGGEEWEQGLREQQERAGEMVDYEDGYDQAAYPAVTPPMSTSAFSSTHPSPYRSQSTRTRVLSHALSVGHNPGWRGEGVPDEAALRRHQSLHSFRSAHDQAVAAGTPGDGWVGADDLLSATSSSFGRSRGVTTPAGLTLHHSNSLGSRGGLSHSNSLSSNGHDHVGSGALSPANSVTFPGSRSPWSPTVEETKQLGLGASAAGTPPRGNLSRGSSASSHKEARRIASEENVPQPPPVAHRVTPNPGVGRSLSATAGSSGAGGGAPGGSPSRRLPSLVTNPDKLAQLSHQAPPASQSSTQAFLSRQGPASAAAYVPPIGHSYPQQLPSARPLPTMQEFVPNLSAAPALQHHLQAQLQLQAQAQYQQQQQQQQQSMQQPSVPPMSYGAFTAAPGIGNQNWNRQKEALIGGGPASAVDGGWPSSTGFPVGLALAQQQQIQALQSQMQAAMVAMENIKLQSAGPAGGNLPFGRAGPGSAYLPPLAPPPALAGANGANAVESPIDLPALIAQKGYNPVGFDLRPPQARFFVIKSFQEEDVHKSIRHEIWSSTQLGNKRLDRAFRESAEQGPLFLFFSVNASGHFAGVAQMTTPVDESVSSNVWASDKWKGIMKLKWVFIKDVPLASLRHIRLSNTPENKPVTSSRDTQEVPYEAGCEMLRIIAGYQSRTSLLQDFAWYEARQRANEQGGGAGVPGAGAGAGAGAEVAGGGGRQPHYAQRAQQQAQAQAPQMQQQQQQQQGYYQPQGGAFGQQQGQQQGQGVMAAGGRGWYGGGQQGRGSPANGY